MGCSDGREKIEDKMMLMKLERMQIQTAKVKELKKLSDIEGYEIKRADIPDYIDPMFAREKKIYDEYDEEFGYKKTINSRKKDKDEKNDKKEDNEKDIREKVKKVKNDKKSNKKKKKNQQIKRRNQLYLYFFINNRK